MSNALVPTDEQSAIVAAAVGTSDSILISALAGAAKTTTLELIAKALPTTPTLSLAFNKRIAEEMKSRLPGNVNAATLNSIGHRVWATATGRRLIVNSKKSYDILSETIGSLSKGQKSEAFEVFAPTLKAISMAKLNGYVPEGKFPTARRLISAADFFSEWEWADEEPSDLQQMLVDEALTQSIQAAYKGQVDFDDQIYMPTIFSGPFPKFPLVLVDEAQDLSPLNHAMLEKLVTKRIIAVGDRHQCHPPGTMIALTGGKEIPIETAAIGQSVISYYTQKSVFKGTRSQGRRIENIDISQFKGNLIVIKAEDKIVKVTPNHKCLVRFASRQGYCLYLMKKGDQCRIGIARTQYSHGSGVAMRARQEGADAAWILKIYSSKEIAHVFEEAYSGRFGIPQLLFNYPTTDINPQSNIDAAWKIIGYNWDRGRQILEHFKRDPEFPSWSRMQANNHFGNKSFITEACNLIPGMLMVTMSSNPTAVGADKSSRWVPIEVEYEAYDGPVYGLQVEPTEGGRRLYLANRIIVHNSIYGFRGAAVDSMDRLKSTFSMREMELSVSFRCPIEVVKLARERAPSMQWPEWAAEGRVAFPSEWSPADIPDGAAIICRNNAPLFKLALQLIKKGRGVKLVGTDLGPGLVKALKKLGPESMTRAQVYTAIDNWETERLKKSKAKASIADKADCLRVFASFGGTLSEAIAYAEHLFATSGPIQLLSGHKAKGLEWDTVLHLDPWRIPSKWANGEAELEQEKNIRYVITTRAKKELLHVNLEEFR